jgi:hypothetical protein
MCRRWSFILVSIEWPVWVLYPQSRPKEATDLITVPGQNSANAVEDRQDMRHESDNVRLGVGWRNPRKRIESPANLRVAVVFLRECDVGCSGRNELLPFASLCPGRRGDGLFPSPR